MLDILREHQQVRKVPPSDSERPLELNKAANSGGGRDRMTFKALGGVDQMGGSSNQ
jgi:hypothetical protein